MFRARKLLRWAICIGGEIAIVLSGVCTGRGDERVNSRSEVSSFAGGQNGANGATVGTGIRMLSSADVKRSRVLVDVQIRC